MEERLKQLENEVSELKGIINSLRNNTTIPFDVGEAFKVRVGALQYIATKATSTETQAVNESGSGSYNVAKLMDGFYITDTGKFIPYYD